MDIKVIEEKASKTIEELLQFLEAHLEVKVHDLKDSIERGWVLLKNHHEIDKEKIEALLATDQFGQKLKEGLATWQTIGLSESFISSCHQEAIRLYKERRFEDARDAFLFLTALNHWEPKVWIGYGLSMRHCHNLQLAMLAFAFAIGLDETNPYPYIYYAEVLMELKEMKLAREYLEKAEKRAAMPELRAYIGSLYGN